MTDSEASKDVMQSKVVEKLQRSIRVPNFVLMLLQYVITRYRTFAIASSYAVPNASAMQPVGPADRSITLVVPF